MMIVMFTIVLIILEIITTNYREDLDNFLSHEKKNVENLKKMTLMQRCTTILPIMFWQVVNLAVFAYAIAFYFYPDDVNKLYVNAQETDSLKFTGVLLALTSGGLNQMVACNMKGSERLSRFAFLSSLLIYILASVAGIYMLSMETVFIEEQRYLFLVLFSLFIAGILVGVIGSCRGFCKIEAGAGGAKLETVVTAEISRKSTMPKSRAELIAAARNP